MKRTKKQKTKSKERNEETNEQTKGLTTKPTRNTEGHKVQQHKTNTSTNNLAQSITNQRGKN